MDLFQEIALKWPEAFVEPSPSSGIIDDKNNEEQELVEPVIAPEDEDEINEEELESELEETEEKKPEKEKDEEDTEPEEKPKQRKNNSNIKKLLAERKELKQMVWDLTSKIDKVTEWLSKVEDGKYYQNEKDLFLKQHPEATENMQKIDEVRQKFPKMSFEYAYKIVSPESFVSWTNNPNTNGYTPSNLKAGKDISKMTTAELDKEVQKQFNEWTLNLFN